MEMGVGKVPMLKDISMTQNIKANEPIKAIGYFDSIYEQTFLNLLQNNFHR